MMFKRINNITKITNTFNFLQAKPLIFKDLNLSSKIDTLSLIFETNHVLSLLLPNELLLCKLKIFALLRGN